MVFCFVLSLKSLIAAISQRSVSLALVAPTEAAELHTWCPGYCSIYVREGSDSTQSVSIICSVIAMSLVCFEFAIG